MRYKNHRKYHKDILLLLSEASHRQRHVCPKCGGGSSKELSITISQQERTVLFHCHRASCGLSGRLTSTYAGTGTTGNTTNGTLSDDYGQTYSKQYRQYTTIQNSTANTVYSKYSISNKLLQLYDTKQTEDGSLVFPIRLPIRPNYGRHGQDAFDGMVAYKQIGHVVRRLDNRQPKALTRLYDKSISKKTVLSHYNHQQYNNDLVIVEDMLSAIKASEYVDTIALLGVNLTHEEAELIASLQYDNVYMALDRDATVTAARHVKNYGLLIDNLNMMILKKDLKDTAHKELERILWRV